MEEKYKKYLQFSWKDSSEWQLYYSNLFPTPPPTKIEKYKKKFYKSKIDPDFDIDYIPPEPQNTSSNSSYSNNSTNTNAYNNTSSNYSYNYSQPNYGQSVPQINSKLLMNIESIFFVAFLLSLPFQFHSVLLVCLGLGVRTYRYVGKPQFNMNFLQVLLLNEACQSLLVSIILLTDRFNYYMIMPTAIGVIVYLSENANTLNMAPLQKYKKYIDIVLNKKNELLQSKAHLEVACGVLLIPGIFLKLNRFILPMVYWQLLNIRYVVNPYIKNTFALLNQQVTKFRNQSFVPRPVANIIEKGQQFVSNMGNMQNAQNGAARPGCIIF